MHLDPGAGLTEQFLRLPDGRRLRTVVAGEGDPLVVFECGLGASAGEWVTVQRLLAPHVRTLSYDRAGHGGSDHDPEPRTLTRIADDLAALLTAAGHGSTPTVLVGHSWGGPILRTFVSRHPGRAVGLVLIDATVVETMSPHLARQAAALARVQVWLASVGLAPLLMRALLPTLDPAKVSGADQHVMFRDYCSRRSIRTARREAIQIAPALEGLRKLQADGLPDMPTCTLVGTQPERGTAKLRPLLIDAADREMAAHPHGRLVRVPGAGHLVPQQQPRITAETILELVSAVRAAPAH